MHRNPTPKQVLRAETCRETYRTLSSGILHTEKPVVSIDIEVWDVDHSRLKEVGIVVVVNGRVVTSIHWRIKENATLRNRYTTVQQSPYVYGLSVVVNSGAIHQLLSDALTECTKRWGEYTLIAHNIKSDMRFLRLSLPHFSLPQPVTLVDTQDFYCGYKQVVQAPSVSAIAAEAGVPFPAEWRHNAGNDAWITAAWVVKLSRAGKDN